MVISVLRFYRCVDIQRLGKNCFPPLSVKPVGDALDMHYIRGIGLDRAERGFVVFPEDLVVEQGAELGGEFDEHVADLGGAH